MKEVSYMVEKYIFINNHKTKYTIDTDGRIFSEISNKYLKPFKNKCGYLLVDIHLNGKSYTRQVHRLVADAFIPNPENLPTVNHIDGCKENNVVTNLEWMSILDNVRHAWNTGLATPKYGVDNPSNVYSEEQIRHVCELLEIGKYSNKSIAEMCNVNIALIRDIKFRGKWKHISSEYNINTIPIGYKHLRSTILQMMTDGYSNQEIIEKLGLPNSKKRHIEYVRSIYNHSLND